MNDIFDIIDKHKTKFGNQGKVFAHSDAYSAYITTEVFTSELIRNILLALLCIFLVTLLLLTDILGSLLVLICVLITLLDVAGFMYFWGLTIETITSLLITVFHNFTYYTNTLKVLISV